MRTRYKVIQDGSIYFITSTIVEWIPVFTSCKYSNIIINSLKYCRENKGLKIYAYVIMDNHIHLIAAADELPGIMKDLKSFTAKEIVKTAEEEKKEWLLNQLRFYKRLHKAESAHQVWQEGYHPQMITSEEMLLQKKEYIHANPLRRGLVARPEHWSYSSASNYVLGSGLLDVDMIEI